MVIINDELPQTLAKPERSDRKILFRTSVFLGLFLLALLTSGISASAESPQKVCVKDDALREVCVSPFPKRVISLAPSLTEIIFDLGAGPLLVGRTARCNDPPEALKTTEIGEYMNPDLERIISLKPDLVLSPERGMRREVVNRLSDLGIPVFVDNGNTLDEIVLVVERLGTILGKKSEADSVIKEFQHRRQAVAEHVARSNRPTILFAVGTRPLVVAGGKSFIGSLIREAHGSNVAEDSPTPYPRFSMEEVIRSDPDLILVLNKDCSKDECIRHWQEHKMLKAVNKGLVYEIDADLVARPAPKIMDALEKLAAILHPKMFGKVAPHTSK